MGITIKDAPLVEQLSGDEKIPISDGSKEPRTVNIEQIKEFANKDIEIPTKVSELENDSGYATSKEVEDAISKIPTPDVGGQISAALEGYVKKVEGKGLSTNDFTNELKTKLEGITPYDPSELETEIGKLETALNTLVVGDASNAIESFNEIIAFLDGISDNEDLDSIIASIEQQIASKYSKPLSGIPKSDFSSDVQSSLNKSETALQEEQFKGTVVAVDTDESVDDPNIPSGSYDDTEIKKQIAGLESEVERKQENLISGQNIKTINGKSLLGEGDIEIERGDSYDDTELKNQIKDLETEVSKKADEAETDSKLSELGSKKQNKIKNIVDSITDSVEDSIEVLDDSGNIIVKIKKDSVNVKCLKVDGKEILLKEFLDKIIGVEDALEGEESVKIYNNDNELIFEINNDGVTAKSIKLINGETLSTYNVLHGKKWVVVGDSFSTNADELITSDSYIESGKYKGKLKDYGYIIGSRNNMDIVDFHAGGKTIAYPVSSDFSNSFCNPNSNYTKAYKDIPLDADYITIQLGINDQSHMIQSSGDGEDITGLITLGTIDSKDISTFYGAWNTAIEWILTNLPFAHVGIIITNGLGNSNGSWNDTGNDYDAKKLYEAEIAIAERWGIPYLDLNGDARCPMMHRGYNPKLCNEVIQLRLSAFTEGAYGTHPNSKAYEYESTFIENFLRSI